MSATQKAYLTKNQVISRLREIVEEPLAEKRMQLIHAFKQTNGPEVVRASLTKMGFSASVGPSMRGDC